MKVTKVLALTNPLAYIVGAPFAIGILLAAATYGIYNKLSRKPLDLSWGWIGIKTKRPMSIKIQFNGSHEGERLNWNPRDLSRGSGQENTVKIVKRLNIE